MDVEISQKEELKTEILDAHFKDQVYNIEDNKGYSYTSDYDYDGNIVFNKRHKESNKFFGFVKQVELFDKIYKPAKPQHNFEGMDSTVIAFIASKNKGDREEATELLVQKFMRRNRIYTTRNDKLPDIWIYKKGIYIPEGRTYIQEFCRKQLDKLYTTSICNQVISKIEADTYINEEDFFVNENLDLVPVQNGILNIKTKELLNFSPDYRFFNKLKVDYNPKLYNESINEFFKTILLEKDIPIIQEIFGYALHRDYFIHKSFMFNGKGRNGKGVTLNLMEKLIGKDNCCDLTLKDMEKDEFTLCRLHNKMLNISGDINNSKIYENGSFKKLTGGDTITARRKFKTDIHFKNYAKMIFACNELPDFHDDSDGNWLRWILIDFPFQFKPKNEYNKLTDIEKIEKNIRLANPSIIDELTTDENMTVLLNWALIGLERLYKNNEFSFSESVKQRWKMKSNNLLLFVNTMCTVAYGQEIISSDFKEEYSLFCQQNKLKAITAKRIVNTLEKEFAVFPKRNQNGILYTGININKNMKENLLKSYEK